MNSELRPGWYDPSAALTHARGLNDTPPGRGKHTEYLAWLAQDEPDRKEQKFSEIPQGWIIGTAGFAREMAEEHGSAVGNGWRLANETQLAQRGNSMEGTLAIAAGPKACTTVANRWLGTNLRAISTMSAARWRNGSGTLISCS